MKRRDQDISIDLRGDRKLPKALRVLRRILIGAILFACIICSIGLICSSYSYLISPIKWPITTIVSMSFPFWLFGEIILFVGCLFWWKKMALIPGLTILVCISPIASFIPLNLPKLPMSDNEKERSFTLMTYNVYSFVEFKTKIKEPKQNRQLDYVLKHNPDIVCIQEAVFLAPTNKNRITQIQLDSLHLRYPYIMTCGRNFAVMSKFPVKPVDISFPTEDFQSGDISCWRFTIHNQIVNLFSVHLRSFGLTDIDKNAYEDIVKLDAKSKSEFVQVKKDIAPKLKQAGIERAEQIHLLQKYIEKYGGKNVIICGDFNDVENSYGVQLLARENHMKQVYREVGFGPLITYHANNLYFHIDHILYRGDMKPYKIRCGHISASDHYPQTVTFIMDK